MEIPGYKILQQIGKGGMSNVYLAIQESLQRRVALKVLSPHIAKDKEYCEQLVEEGKTIASLSYTNIVTVYDVGDHGGNYYLSMEHISGGSLRDKMDAGRLEEEEAVTIFRVLIKTLAFAHHRGVLHRDIKPRNILFREDGDLVLTDFGIAHNIHEEEDLSSPGFSLGSPRYMSPEQIRDKGIDKRTDFYSMGIVFYEMLTNKVPFDAGTALDIAKKQLSSPIPKLQDDVKQYQSLINRLLAKKPAERFSETSQILEELNWVTGMPKRRKSDREKHVDKVADEMELTQRLPTETIRQFISADDLEFRNKPTDTLIESQEFIKRDIPDLSPELSLSSLKVPDVDDDKAFATIQEQSDAPRSEKHRSDSTGSSPSKNTKKTRSIEISVDPDDRDKTFFPEKTTARRSYAWFFVPAIAAVFAIYLLLVRVSPYWQDTTQVVTAPTAKETATRDQIEQGIVTNTAMDMANEVDKDLTEPGDAMPNVATNHDRQLPKNTQDTVLAQVGAGTDSGALSSVPEIEVIKVPDAVEIAQIGTVAEVIVIDNTVSSPQPQQPRTIDTSTFGSVVNRDVAADAAVVENKLIDLNQAYQQEVTTSVNTSSDTPPNNDTQQVLSVSITEEAEDIHYSEEELMDVGVEPVGDQSVIISSELELRVRRYMPKVERLQKGQLKIVLEQQDLYEGDSALLDVAAKKYLDQLGFVLRNYSGFSINVIDRTRQDGSLVNRNLSWGRARSVSDYLVRQGISADRVHHRGNALRQQAGVVSGIEILLTPVT